MKMCPPKKQNVQNSSHSMEKQTVDCKKMKRSPFHPKMEFGLYLSCQIRAQKLGVGPDPEIGSEHIEMLSCDLT